VRVEGGRRVASGDPLPVWLSGFVGKDSFEMGADAIAVGGAPCDATCPVPFALPACMLYVNGKIDCTADRVYKNDWQDNICFTNLVAANQPVPDEIPDNCVNNASNACVRSILNNQVCTVIEKGDMITLMNGADENQQIINAAENYIRNNGGDPDVGIEVMAPIIDSGSECKCNQTAPVVGFAKFTFALDDVDGDGKYDMIKFGHDCQEVTNAATRSGCTYFGTAAPNAQPRLVK
jgi:hypothetical protein